MSHKKKKERLFWEYKNSLIILFSILRSTAGYCTHKIGEDSNEKGVWWEWILRPSHPFFFSDLLLNKGMQNKMNNEDLSDNNMKHRFADPITKSDSKMKLQLRGDSGDREDIVRMMRDVIILSIRGT